MTEPILRGFRLLKIKDLTTLSKAEVAVSQVTSVSHDAGQESETRTYEDHDVPDVNIRKSLTGNISIKGDIAAYVNPSYAATVRTASLFELDHYYLIRFLAISAVSGTSKMVYHRWIGQLKELPKINLESANLAEHEVLLAVALYRGTTTVSLDTTKPYIATADADPGPANADPTADYWPLFQCIVADTTKTLEAAETIIGSIVNPM